MAKSNTMNKEEFLVFVFGLFQEALKEGRGE
jgi:hypothetical protein